MLERATKQTATHATEHTAPPLQEPRTVASGAVELAGEAPHPSQEKPWLWGPGQTGNPAGRPKKGHSFGEVAMRELDKLRAGSDITGREHLVRHAVKMACSDEPHGVRWAELILDRTEGKVTQPIEVSNVLLVMPQDDYDALP